MLSVVVSNSPLKMTLSEWPRRLFHSI